MAAIGGSTFDAQTSGNATAATTGASSEVGAAASRQHSAVQKVGGAASMYCSGTATSSYLIWNFTATTKVYCRFYVRRETVSSNATACVMAQFRNTSLAAPILAWEPNTGALRVRDVSTVRATYPVTTGQWYRIDWQVDFIAAQQRVWLYTGATIHSANTADAVAGGAALAVSNTGATLDRMHLGYQLGVTPEVNFYLDELAIDNAVMPPPYVPPAAGRRLERKASGVWAPQILEKKVSGVWMPQIIERKDAGVWS